VSLLNFTITLSGLEDQLLNAVLTEELPELATAKEQLALSGAAMVAELYGIESNILRLLSESEGNILDNTALIETLAEAKVRLVLLQVVELFHFKWLNYACAVLVTVLLLVQTPSEAVVSCSWCCEQAVQKAFTRFLKIEQDYAVQWS
jgi:ATP-binding dynein motor region